MTSPKSAVPRHRSPILLVVATVITVTLLNSTSASSIARAADSATSSKDVATHGATELQLPSTAVTNEKRSSLTPAGLSSLRMMAKISTHFSDVRKKTLRGRLNPLESSSKSSSSSETMATNDRLHLWQKLMQRIPAAAMGEPRGPQEALNLLVISNSTRHGQQQSHAGLDEDMAEPIAMILPSSLMKELADTANAMPQYAFTQILASLLKPIFTNSTPGSSVLEDSSMYFEEALAQVIDGPGRKPYLRVINSTLKNDQVLDDVLTKTLGVEVPHLRAAAEMEEAQTEPDFSNNQDDHVINIILINFVPEKDGVRGTPAVLLPTRNHNHHHHYPSYAGPLPPPYPSQLPNGPIGPSNAQSSNLDTFQDLYQKISNKIGAVAPTGPSTPNTLSNNYPGILGTLRPPPPPAGTQQPQQQQQKQQQQQQQPILTSMQHLPMPAQLQDKIWSVINRTAPPTTATSRSPTSNYPSTAYAVHYYDAAGKRNPIGPYPPNVPLPSTREQIFQRTGASNLPLAVRTSSSSVVLALDSSTKKPANRNKHPGAVLLPQDEPAKPNFSRLTTAARLAMLPTIAAGAAAVWPLWIRLLTSLSSNRRMDNDEQGTDGPSKRADDEVVADIGSSYGYDDGHPLLRGPSHLADHSRYPDYNKYLNPPILVRGKRSSFPQEVNDFLYWLRKQHVVEEETTEQNRIKAPIGPSVPITGASMRSAEDEDFEGFASVFDPKPAQPKGILTKEDGTYIQTQLTVVDNFDKRDTYPINHRNASTYSSYVKNQMAKNKPHVSLSSGTLSPIRASVSSATVTPGNLVTFTFVQNEPSDSSMSNSNKQSSPNNSDKGASYVIGAFLNGDHASGVGSSKWKESFSSPATSRPMTYINGVAVPTDMLRNESYMREKFGNEFVQDLFAPSSSSTWLADHYQHASVSPTTPMPAVRTTAAPLTKYDREKLYSASTQSPYLVSYPLGNHHSSKYPNTLVLDYHPGQSTSSLLKSPATPPTSVTSDSYHIYSSVSEKYYTNEDFGPLDTSSPSSGKTQYLNQAVSFRPTTSAPGQHDSTSSKVATNPFYHFVTSTQSSSISVPHHDKYSQSGYTNFGHSSFAGTTGYGGPSTASTLEASATASPGWVVRPSSTTPAPYHQPQHHYENSQQHYYPSSTPHSVYSYGGHTNHHQHQDELLARPEASILTDRTPDNSNPAQQSQQQQVDSSANNDTPATFETSVITNAESTGVRVQLRPVGIFSSLAVLLGGLGLGVFLFPALSATSLAVPFLRRREDKGPAALLPSRGQGPSNDYAYDYDELPVAGSQISRADAESTKYLSGNKIKNSNKKASPGGNSNRQSNSPTPAASGNNNQQQQKPTGNTKNNNDNYDYYYDYYDSPPTGSDRGASSPVAESNRRTSNRAQEKVSSPHVLRRLVENVKSAMDYLKRKDNSVDRQNRQARKGSSKS